MFYKIITLFFFLISDVSFAGGWVMGGAHQIGNNLNPWFLQSNKKIQYCVSVDKTSISSSENQINKMVASSLEYWRLDFEKLNKLVPENQKNFIELSLPTQGFEKVACSLSPSLRFLFGRGVLSPEEAAYLEKYDIVAGSVRTDYDEVKLIGRGFVYIPSDIGPNSFVKPDQIERPWEKAGLLFRALVHEIGHVYGLQHSDRGVMMADYPETILNKSHFDAFSRVETLPSTLLPAPNQMNIKDATVSLVEKGIKVVTKESLGQPSVNTLPSGITLEWSLIVKSPTGENKPMLIRSSPFVFETYSIEQNKIQLVSRFESQCRLDECDRD